MTQFIIRLDDKPHLTELLKKDKQAFKDIVVLFVDLMEVTAKNEWHTLPSRLGISLTYKEIVLGMMNAIFDVKALNEEAYAALGDNLHPLSLLSDTQKDIVTGEQEYFDWKRYFVVDDDTITQETLEKIIRKLLYLVRWFSIDEVSNQLLANQFPIVDPKDLQKLPFQPALVYQQESLGELAVGKFMHDIGAFDCGEVEKDQSTCPACQIGKLVNVNNVKVCPRCNAGFREKEEMTF